MNMTAMNQAAGGPVGGGMMMMNNGGGAAMPNTNINNIDMIKPLLNTYIYEYCLKNGHYDIARALVKDEKFELRTIPRQSPGRRKDGDMNGADGDAMEMDAKDDIPEDLERPSHGTTNSGHEGLGFLFEWFAIFSDIFQAHRGQGKTANAYMTPATQYLLQHQQLQRMRENQQNQNLGRPGMMPNHIAQMRAASQMRNGMTNGDMRAKPTPQQMAMLQQQKAMQQNQQQMPRGDQPDSDPNVRPATPADGENGGSPSKRPRLEGQQFNAAMMQNGRPGVPGVAPQTMMIQNGFNPAMNQARFQQNGGIPPKMPAGMANGMMNMSNSGSPMMAAMNQFTSDGMPADMYSARMPGQVMQGAPNGQSGNHALQDYQMQLMLLEQQNKKRLMMARQEQHENQPRDGQPMPGGVIPPGMSPQGSRNGTSPNPAEQMKRAAQMAGMPSSPSAGEMQGRSPAGGMGFMNGMPQDFNATAMFMKDAPGMMGPGGPGMRPPTSAVDMNAMNRQAQQSRMVNQFQGGQPMVQQQSQGQPQPIGTPGQRNEMPPPSAPAANNSAQRNNQPASPANSNAPPTPSQSNKPNPKNKKGKDEANRKRPQKKNSTVNAPNSEENAPAATTPSTPITPGHPNSFNGSANKGQVPQQSNQQSQPNQAMPTNQQQMPGPDLAQSNTFPDFNGPDQNYNLDFSTLENTDVLENFDFDSFLNTSADDAFNFDGGMVETFGMDATGE